MTGMMDTILNVGLTKDSGAYWEGRLGPAAAQDCWDRLCHMYGNVVKAEVPSTLDEQLLGSIEAVFKSWNNERAVEYRKVNGIPNDWGTAVIIQAMVFGNLNDKSGSGVLFTRNRDSGENVVTGEFLINAQGEDVVAGTRTPMKLAQMAEWDPKAYKELIAVVKGLEAKLKDMQDVEFTVQDGELFILQVRTGKRTPRAAVKIAMDLLKEKKLTAKEALKRVSAREFWEASMPVIDPAFKAPAKWTGIPAVSGVVTGLAVDSASALKCTEPYILVGKETNPDDFAAMYKSRGVLTLTGGETAHAAVVCTSMNRACVVGLGLNHPDLSVEDLIGKKISIDGATGRVWEGEVPVVAPSASGDLAKFEDLIWRTVEKVPVNYLPRKKVPKLVVDVSSDLGAMAIGRAAWKVEAAIAKADEVIVVTATPPVSTAESTFFGMFGNQYETARNLLIKKISMLPPAKYQKVTFRATVEIEVISLSKAVSLLLG
jgi:pyruvate,orthophosphate dikinase